MDLPPVPWGKRRILLIRHGETHANAQGIVQGCRIDAHLNERGEEQARSLAFVLKDFDIGVVSTSNLVRAKSTAALALREVVEDPESLPWLVLSELREMDYGPNWDGKHLSNVVHELKSIGRRWAQGECHLCCPDGGESPEHVLARAQQALRSVVDRLRSAPKDAVGIVVAHNFVNKVLISYSATGSLANMHKFEQSHACVNVLDVDSESLRIELIKANFSEHLSLPRKGRL